MNCVPNKVTSLQIALGLFLIGECHVFGICGSYDEILSFKTSAVHASSHKTQMRCLFNINSGLNQRVADNYDANVSSPNCLRSPHSLSFILTQLTEDGTSEKIEGHPSNVPVIRRISKDDFCGRIIPSLIVIASQ